MVPVAPAEKFTDRFGRFALPRNFYISVLRDQLGWRGKQAVMRSERVLISAGVKKGKVLRLAFFQLGHEDIITAGSIFIIRIAGASGKPDAFKGPSVSVVDWHHVPLLMDRPSIQEIIHETTVNDIPTFGVRLGYWFLGNHFIIGDLRRGDDVSSPLHSQVWVPDTGFVAHFFYKLHNFFRPLFGI